MTTKKPNLSEKVIEMMFGDPSLVYGLKEFEETNISEILEIIERGSKKYYIKDYLSSEFKLVFDDEKKRGKPEEIIRQLWLQKLHQKYKYPLERIATEKGIRFGREVGTKSADIVVYKADKVTPYIIIEVKSPTERKGIEQLRSYLNAEGAEIGLWSNGDNRVILYRHYPKEFNDSLPDLPRADQSIDDLLEEKKTYFDHTTEKADLRKAILNMEELVLANAGVDVFNEVFKLIYAKLFDESEAKVHRTDHEVLFRKYGDTQKTYSVISDLFQSAVKKWPGTFQVQDTIRLSPEHLSIVVGELERVRLFGSDLSIIDEAFEHLVPEVVKSKKGQYFTPRHVIAMAVKMVHPKRGEYVIDPASGSGGFLVNAMYAVRDRELSKSNEAMREYAQEYIWGIDFADELSKVARALMLIAGDGRSHIFKLNSLDPREWKGEDAYLLHARAELSKHLHQFGNSADDAENKQSFHAFDFDVVLTNPPFAGEIRDTGLLRQYDLAKKKGKLVNKIERHILFIERTFDLLKPGGRMAVVLPQGVFNNTNMQYVREYLFDKARIFAVVGLHGNTFKPHTGTKTSVLFLQKWGGDAGEPKVDYPIFMAVSKKAGKDNSGDYVYRKDKNGNAVTDARGRKVLDSDLDDIADAFMEWGRKEELSFIV